MAALQCEICGGKLMGRPGGIFECDSCGMEYDTAWAKEKIQEIKGTVKVEGTVEVTGTVKVEGGISIENLLKRAMMCCADEEWEKAEQLLEQALNIDPECAEAYVGKLMVTMEVCQREELGRCDESFEDDSDFLKAMQFGSKTLKAELRKYLDQVCERIQKTQKSEEAQKMREQQELLNRLTTRRSQIALASSLIAAGSCSTVGLKSDSTVIAEETYEQNNGKLEDWFDIKAIAADSHIVGLKADGTVVAVGDNKQGQCCVSEWCDVVAVAAGRFHTVGLKADGTVVAVGANDEGQCNVSEWTNIVAVSAGHKHTVGLKADGTVVAVGLNNSGQCNVKGWKNIVEIAAGDLHTVGLKNIGQVIATGNTFARACKVNEWRDIVAIAAGNACTVGLQYDGRVVTTEDRLNVDDWSDMIAVSAGSPHIVGLTSKGTLRFSSTLKEITHNVSGWKLFQNLDTIEQERSAAWQRVKAEVEQRIQEKKKRKNELETESVALQKELLTLKGLFSGIRRKQIETRLSEIESELKGL